MPTASRRGDPPPPTTLRPPAARDTDAALQTLYRDHRAALLAYAERFTADRGRAEDIVQETFVRAWRHLPRLLADDRPLRPWLYQVTRRLSIDAARADDARPVLVLDDGSMPEPAVAAEVDRLLDRTVLADAVRSLSPHHRTLVIETYLRDMPTTVTAARLGVPAGTARSRLHYALTRLRQDLDASCVA
jgi:RNA polymerase sigma-70 factor (ECF subfamily)